MQTIRADICVIGAGSGGLSVAAGAAQLGRKTVLIEKDEMGGDCLNTGCVPSKALLAAAEVANTLRAAEGFGIVGAGPPRIDGAAVHAHLKDVIARIAPNDSQTRFEGLGATVIRAPARFVDGRTVEAGQMRIVARRFVVATGSRPAMPSIDGLDSIPVFTNETIFDKDTMPDHLLIVGGGAVGCEMAQAHARLGSAVTLVEAERILPRDDEEAAGVVRTALAREGVTLFEAAQVRAFAPTQSGIEARIATAKGETAIAASHVLVAVGRRPNVEELGLEAAQIAYNAGGIVVDEALKTTNRRVYAVGDVTGAPQFTHVANYHAGLVIRSALFRLPVKTDYSAIPRVTFTDPELAQVGLTEALARTADRRMRVVRAEFADNDRAATARRHDGFAKLVVERDGRLAGATIVGPHAGELIGLVALALGQKIKLSTLASMTMAYPTLSEVTKRAAGAYYTPALFGWRSRVLVRLLGLFG